MRHTDVTWIVDNIVSKSLFCRYTKPSCGNFESKKYALKSSEIYLSLLTLTLDFFTLVSWDMLLWSETTLFGIADPNLPNHYTILMKLR